MFHTIDGLKSISDDYQTFLMDVWGVLHDGQLLSGALEVLEHLQEQGKKVILFSNAPRRCHVAQKNLERLGVARRLYNDILTSGERTYKFLQELQTNGQVREVFHIGPSKDLSLFEDLHVLVGKNANTADWIVCSGTEDINVKETDMDPLFHGFLSRDVPMICANTDRYVSYQGELILCAGALAQRYKDLGGQVHFFGKPEKGMYQDAVPKTGATLAVGDSLYTDVQGAMRAGIDVLFIQGGIHRNELGALWGEEAVPSALQQLFTRHNVAEYAAHKTKIYTLPCLRWYK